MIIIAALTKNHVLGSKGKMLWDIPEGKKLFQSFVKGKTLIMGRKTFESAERHDTSKKNYIVISRSMKPQPGIDVVRSPQEALEKAQKYGTEIFCLGGGEIYKQMLPFSDALYLSWIKKEYDGDAYFPKFDMAEWKVTQSKDCDEFTFRIYKRKAAST